MKKSVIFIIPGLSGPLPKEWKGMVRDLKPEPTFEAIFKRARSEQGKYNTLNDTLNKYFGINPSEALAWSWLGLYGEGIDTNSIDWFKIELLTENGMPFSCLKDIKKIAADFSKDFSFSEEILVTENGHWYMKLDRKHQVASTPIWNADVQDVTLGLTGRDAAFWQLKFRAANEWLKRHPINMSRTRRYRLPLVSFWLWGNHGTNEPNAHPDFTAVFSDNPLYLGLADRLRLSFFPLRLSTGDLNQMVHNHPRICVIDDSLIESIAEGDFRSWCQERSRICTKLIEPTLLAIERGVIDNFIIDNGMGHRFIYDKRIKLVISKAKFHYNFS